MKPLLPLACFESIFGPLVGQRVAVTEGCGVNKGDTLLYRATEQLLDRYGIEWTREIDDRTEHVLLFAGGNLCGPYYNETKLREDAMHKATNRRLPMTQLPQSCFRVPDVRDMLRGRKFARERESQSLLRSAVYTCELAPDLALGYCLPDKFNTERVRAMRTRCFIIRTDYESTISMDDLQVNWPVHIRWPSPNVFDVAAEPSLDSYVENIVRCNEIFTDRLHVAIVGLMAGCDVTLLPNSYHKNRSMWETWLRDLGCKWMDRDEFLRMPKFG